MLPADAKLISVDDHLIEPPHLWQRWLPSRFRDNGPRMLDENGQNVWLFEGRRYEQVASFALAGSPPETWARAPMRLDEIRPGCYNPVERIRDMDHAGVDSAVCFPNLPRFSGTLFLECKDRDLALACVRAWNDFMIEEWCSAAPDRLIPLALLPLWDVNLAVGEAVRVADKGVRTITFPEIPGALGLPSIHTGYWDPLFATVQERNLPLALHFGSSGITPVTSADAPLAVMIALMGQNSMMAMTDFLFSPVLHRFPNLSFMLAEGGIGWIPYVLEKADVTWEKHRSYQDINREIRPSTLFHDHFWGCFIEDEAGLQARYSIGVDRIMLECDYPHADSSWPHTRANAEKMLSTVPDEEARLIVEGNARQLLNWPRT